MLLMKAYFPPGEALPVPPSRHPLLKSLTQQLPDRDEIRNRVVDIIQSTELFYTTRDGAQTLERFFLGRLMNNLRGKVDPNLAKEIVKAEVEVHFEIEAPSKKGGYYTVKKK